MKSPRPERPRPFTARRLVALVVAVACGWVAYALYGEAAQDREAQAEVVQLRAADTALAAQIAQRSEEITQAQSTAWVEDQARKLGYHLPGEQVYVVDPGGTSVPASAGVNAAPISFSPTPAPTPTPSPTPSPTANPSPTATPTATPTPAPTLLPLAPPATSSPRAATPSP
jgi:cell division protein FtsB